MREDLLPLILSVAQADERVRAVYMNGSRANPNVQPDEHQDYDIVYVVTETQTFINDKTWISVFGKLAIVQEPDSNDLGWGENHDFTRSYTWLMLFEDGNRIDLHIEQQCSALEGFASDTLCVKLLDKDGVLPEPPPSSDKGYWIQRPTSRQFAGCFHEFWVCLGHAP